MITTTTPGSTAVRRPVRNIALWIGACSIVAFIGAFGYMIIEGWGLFDSLYMSVITLATVGFKEVHPMDRGGQVWTMLLSVAAVAIIFGPVGIAAGNAVAEGPSGRREARRMERIIAAMSQHFIVCGFGRVGSYVARELRADGKDVVIIDVDQSSLERAKDDGFPIMPGDGASDDVLIAAGVQRARALISAIDSDANSVFVTLTARSLNPDLFIVGRAGARSVMSKLEQAGADRAVSPYVMAGRQIVELALRPGVIDFIDTALGRGDLSFSMEELSLPADSSLVGQSVGDLRKRGIFTLAIKHGPGDYEPNPGDDRPLVAGEGLIVSGDTQVLHALNDEAGRAAS